MIRRGYRCIVSSFSSSFFAQSEAGLSTCHPARSTEPVATASWGLIPRPFLIRKGMQKKENAKTIPVKVSTFSEGIKITLQAEIASSLCRHSLRLADAQLFS